ncbi:MAG: histidine phosphatase family protein [Candidatus Omnitrophica bacterium]|nr:histidine phosphatase family protein [Candidatus Omnitrophota bacterium]
MRHGQTDWNFEQRIQGHADLPLNALGRSQASRLAGYFAHSPAAALYSSHLKRSLETAQTIGQAIGIEVIVERDLAEIALGQWEGLTGPEVDLHYDGAYGLWQHTPSHVQIPGAEPLPAFRARARLALERILHHHPEGRVIVVTHGGIIASLLADCLGADYDAMLRRLALDNGGISALEPAHQPPHVLWINDTGHLASEVLLRETSDR